MELISSYNWGAHRPFFSRRGPKVIKWFTNMSSIHACLDLRAIFRRDASKYPSQRFCNEWFPNKSGDDLLQVQMGQKGDHWGYDEFMYKYMLRSLIYQLPLRQVTRVILLDFRVGYLSDRLVWKVRLHTSQQVRIRPITGDSSVKASANCTGWGERGCLGRYGLCMWINMYFYIVNYKIVYIYNIV